MEEKPEELSNQSESKKNKSKSPGSSKLKGLGIGLVVLALVSALVFGIYSLARADATTTSQVRDIFIIVLAVESIIIGAALVILVFQVAALFNLLQNEIRPILESTRVTLSTLKGTTTFLSEHAVKPVISMSSTMAGFKKILGMINLGRK